MIKSYLLTLTACFLLSFVSAQTQPKKGIKLFQHENGSSRSLSVFSYSLTTLSEPYADLTGSTSINNGEIWDEPDFSFPVSFPFNLLSSNITYFEFYGSGSLMHTASPDPNVDAYVFPFEMDLVDRGALGNISLSPISYKVEGSSGNHILKMEFKNAGSYYEMAENGTLDMFVNFQLWLYEGSNKIEFRFGPSFIDDTDLFYGGEPGPFAGIADYNETDDIITNPHFIAGNVSNPMLSMTGDQLSGMPSNGTVYRLSIDEPLEVNVTGQNGNSTCMPNGTATAEVTGGIEPYSYVWSNGGNTSTISNLSAGIYSVTVTDANSGTATGSVVITSPFPINVNATSTDETAVNANDGTASAFPTGGTSPYAYEWSNGSNQSIISGLAPGVYTVTVTDQSDCTSSQSVTVNPFGCPEITLESSVQNVSCFGLCDGSITIVHVFGGSPPFNYDWGSLGETTASAMDLCIGSYSVIITDNSGCIVIGTFEITQPALLLANAGSTDESIHGANDGTAWAVPTGGTTPFSYQWNNGSVDSLITNLTPGTYSVTVSDNNNCTTNQEVVVQEGPCGILEAQIYDDLCFQACYGIIIVSFPSGISPITYEWSNGDSTPNLELLCAGEYTITATDNVGCVVIASYTIQEPPVLLSNGGSTGETILGNDGAAWVSPTGGTPPYSYQWSNGSTDSLIVSLDPDVYTVTVTDVNGCVKTQNIEVEEFICIFLLDFDIVDASCFDICDGSISIFHSGVGPFSYVWNTGDTTETLQNQCAGNYFVQVFDQGNSCGGTIGEFTITSPDSLRIQVDEVVNLTDTTSASISVSVNGGTMPYSYLWFGPGGFISTDEDLSDIPPGLYSIVVTDANGCFANFNSIEVEDETVSTQNISNLDFTFYPNPTKGRILINATDFSNYKVEIIGYEGRIVSSSENVNSLDLSDFAPGVYALKITSGAGYAIRRVVIAR